MSIKVALAGNIHESWKVRVKLVVVPTCIEVEVIPIFSIFNESKVLMVLFACAIVAPS